MTPGTEPALTPDEWLSGVNRGKATRNTLGGTQSPQTGRADASHSAPHRSHPDVTEGGLQEDIQNCL